MTIFYKFKSAKDYDTISMDGHFISINSLKEKICQAKQLEGGNDLDIVICNPHTNEEYLDGDFLIPKNTSVLIRPVPTHPRITDAVLQQNFGRPPREEEKLENVQTDINKVTTADASAAEADEETKLKALIDTPALDWQKQGRYYGLGMAGRMGGRGFGIERKTPHKGYICHRCSVPGHFIQHCPTNGDPKYNFKRPQMLMATPDVSSSLPNGAYADAFEREMEEGLPSTTRMLESSNSSAEIAGSIFQVEGPSSQYFSGVQPGFNNAQPGFHYGSHAFMAPFRGVVPPFFGYGLRPMDMSFGSVMNPYPFTAQGFGFPNNIPPPHRDLAEMATGMNLQCGKMGEARKAEMRQNERLSEGGNVMREGESSRMMSYSATSSSSHVKPKSSKQEILPPATYYNSRRRPERFSEHDRRPNRHLTDDDDDDDNDNEDKHYKSKRSRR